MVQSVEVEGPTRSSTTTTTTVGTGTGKAGTGTAGTWWSRVDCGGAPISHGARDDGDDDGSGALDRQQPRYSLCAEAHVVLCWYFHQWIWCFKWTTPTPIAIKAFTFIYWKKPPYSAPLASYAGGVDHHFVELKGTAMWRATNCMRRVRVGFMKRVRAAVLASQQPKELLSSLMIFSVRTPINIYWRRVSST